MRALGPNRATQLCQTPASKIHLCFQGWVRDFPDAQTVLDPLFSGRSIAPQANTNLSQLDDRELNQEMAAARALVDPAARARAWARVDRHLVNLAPSVALSWPTFPAVRAANVVGQVSWLNGGVWDLSFTALR
jgi:ABC-type transport system substrate-binding protein